MAVKRSLRFKLYALTLPLVAALLGLVMLFVIPLFNIVGTPASLGKGVTEVKDFERLGRLLARESGDYTEFLSNGSESEARADIRSGKADYGNHSADTGFWKSARRRLVIPGTICQ